MIQTVLRNKKGVTLVEVLIALVILLIVFMGLLQASLLSIENNVTIALRDEAVRLASDTVTAMSASSFDDLNHDTATDAANATFTLNSLATAPLADRNNATNLGTNTIRTVRNIDENYPVEVVVLDMDTPPVNNNKRVRVTVTWSWKGTVSTHRIFALLRRT